MANEYEIIIVGGGPAGISAGIYSLRAGMKTLVIDSGNSALMQAKKIENYYGVESISGKDLIEKGVAQYKALGGEFLSSKVVGVRKDYSKNVFSVKVSGGEYIAKAVILCMGGNKKKTLNLLEDKKFENVSYCAICDGFFYRGLDVAVVGDDDFAVSESLELTGIAKNVYLLTNGKAVKEQKLQNVKVVSSKITEIVGKNTVQSIVFEDNSKLNIDGLFIALGTMSSMDTAKQLGVLTKNDYIMVDKNYMTNVAGVFAAGDAIGGLLQVSKAVSDGANAGLEAVRFIKIMEQNGKD